MARTLAAGITLAVLAAHLLVLQMLGAMWQEPTQLQSMATPFFTRELQRSEPPPPPALKSEKKTKKAQNPPAYSASDSIAEPTPTLPQQSTPTEAVTAQAPAEQAVASNDGADLSPASGLPTAAESKISIGPGPAPESEDNWPLDTRLSYILSGNYRGPIGGEGRVQWQRQGKAYQVRVELDLSNLTIFTMTSQGQVSPEGLEPTVYEEKRLGAKPLQVTMDKQQIRLNNGQQLERPPEAQDTASQFVELGHRFATGRASLTVGHKVNLWLARPGAAAEWTYDIVAQDTLTSARLGSIPAYHLKPRPLDNPSGPVTAEMWFAPSLQYLPVRIKITLNADTWVDLLIDKIEQAAPKVQPVNEASSPAKIAPAKAPD